MVLFVKILTIMKYLYILSFCLFLSSCMSTKTDVVPSPVATFNFGAKINLTYNNQTIQIYRRDTIPMYKRSVYVAYEWHTACGDFAVGNFRENNKIFSVLFENKGFDSLNNTFIFEEIKNPIGEPYAWYYPQDMIYILDSFNFQILMRSAGESDLCYVYNCQNKKWQIPKKIVMKN